MDVVARFRDSPPEDAAARGNQPQTIVIYLPDWGLGGIRQSVEITLWEALQLRAALNAMFEPLLPGKPRS